ncbi:tetratricopeptide repeat protein [Actinoplanes sp. LDG1-01]|uniref:Tetratricopeptide repeat protein n=1 Tax=Paractinoplanes lichenicola TaxID=2802976 RepID=A0ABS1VVC6_9ACTN|nr:tetratricopeptide repeat protein [Actinoplanes lichenicola]
MYRALLVCNSAYGSDPGLDDLHGPRTDGRLLAAALTDEQTGMFEPAQVSLLYDATRHEIAVQANTFFHEATADDVLLLYFSGHGRSRNGKLYLCATDTVAGLLPSTAVSNETLTDILADSLARTIVIILDCCHGGAFKGGPVNVEQLLSGKGRFVLTATGAAQLADDAAQDGQPSPFTRALVEGLRSGATDADGDGQVDLADLYKFLQLTLRGAPEPRHRFDGYGSVPIARRATTPAAAPPARDDIVATSPSVGGGDGRDYLDGTTGATVLDARRVSEFRERIRPDVGRPAGGSATAFLQSAHLMREGRLTRAGALLFGEDPMAVIPTATVQCTQFHGAGRDSPMDKLVLQGTVPEQIEHARTFVAGLARRGEAPTAESATTEPVYRFPMVAVREIIANALVHRDYGHAQMCVHVRVFADRVEITSPGEWSGADLPDGEPVPLARLAGESRQRNFWLAHVLTWNSLVESEGAGIPRALADCRARGAAEPVVLRSGDAITVTIYPHAAATDAGPSADTQMIDNLPPRSAVFEGRDLTEIDALFAGGATSAVVIRGDGGIGKTQLAVEYAQANRDRYRVAWLISADTPQNVGLGLAGLAARLHPVGTLADAQAWALNWLQNSDDWLLILDGAEGADQAMNLFEQVAGRGRVLLTTRRLTSLARDRQLGFASLHLNVLDRAASVRVLTRLTGLPDEDGAHALAERLGDLPLALHQAAALISDNGLNRLTAALPKLPAPEDVVRVSVDSVRRQSPLAAEILSMLSWLAAEPLPEDVLAPIAGEEAELDRALALLASHSLISRDAKVVRLHRLVQEVARPVADDAVPVLDFLWDRASPPAWTPARLLRRAIPGDPAIGVAGWARWNQLLPHIDALIGNIASQPDEFELLFVVDQAATYRLFQGQADIAIREFERVYAIRQQTLGREHPDTLTSRHNLASAYQTVGRLGEAIEQQQSVLVDYVRLLGDEHPDTLAARNNLARAYRLAGRTAEAVDLHERVVIASRRGLGEQAPDTLTARINLAAAYREAGWAGEAIAHAERVAADCRHVLGDDHPITLNALAVLASAYRVAGRHGESACCAACCRRVPGCWGRSTRPLGRPRGSWPRPSDKNRRARRRAARAARRTGKRVSGLVAPGQAKGDQGARGDDGRADDHGRAEAVDEGLQVGVAAVGAEDGGQGGHSGGHPRLADRVVDAGSHASVLFGDAGQRDRADRGEGQAHADAGQEEGRDQAAVGDGGAGGQADPEDAGGQEQLAGEDQGALADAVAEQAGQRGHDHRGGRPGQGAQAGVERAQALHHLEELGQQEDRAEGAGREGQGHGVDQAEAARAEQAQGQHRGLGARLPEDERGQQRGPADQHGEDAARRPAAFGAVDHAPDDQQHAGRGEQQAEGVELAGAAAGLAEHGQGQHDGHDADGDVQPEDPVPVQALDDRAAHDRADRHAEAADATPDPHGRRTESVRHRLGQQGQGQGSHRGAAQALHRAGGGELPRLGRQGRGRRGQREDDQAGDEHAAAAEAVAERGRGEQERRERQRVGVDEPLQVGQRRVEVGADHRQRRAHDQVVQRDHEGRDADRGQHGGERAAVAARRRGRCLEYGGHCISPASQSCY